MKSATALTPALATLTEALDDPGVDLGTMLDTIGRQVGGMVPSFLGLTITVHSGGIPVTVTTVAPTAAQSAGSCLLLWLTGGQATGDCMMFYAAARGAFADLIAATDPSGTSLNRLFVLDQQPPLMAGLPHPIGVDGLDELSARNRAIGALIAQEGAPLRTGRKHPVCSDNSVLR